MKGGESAKYFYPGWDGNNYSSRCKIGAGINVYPNYKYVVCSHNKAQNADG